MTNLKLILNGAIIFRIFALLFFLIAAGYSQDLKIESLTFLNNRNYKASELKALLKTKKGQKFNAKFLRLDKTILNNFYKSKGFLDIWIDTKVDREGNKLELIFNIQEGPLYRLHEIRISGTQLMNPKKARNYFKIDSAEVFQQGLIESGLNALENYYYNNGKPYIEIKEQVIFRDSLISVNIDIAENETAYIREIDYQGLKIAKRFIVGRELSIKKGEIYSRKKIEASQKNIYSTGLFDYAGTDLKPILGQRENVRLQFNLREKNARWVGTRLGLAYEQEMVYGGTFDFTLEFGHRNLFGTGRSIAFTAIPSLSYDFGRDKFINPKNQFSMTYVEPWIGYTRTPGVLNISYFQVRPLNSANYNYFSSGIQVKHEYENNWQFQGNLSFNQVTILQNDSLDQTFFSYTNGQDFIYSIGTNIIRDKRDNYLATTEGSILETDIKLAYTRSRDRESNDLTANKFLKFSIQWNRYQQFMLKKSWVFATRIKVGNIFEVGKKKDIPLFERFFLGGASSVRGYSEQLLGPVNIQADGSQIAAGGKLMTLANAELRIPLIWLLWGELFFDAGNVWAETNNVNFSEIKTTTGLGFALVTPFGPVRFDYGRKLQPDPGEKTGEFHMSIAFAF